MKFKYLLFPLILFIFSMCERRQWKNPYDPSAISADSWGLNKVEIEPLSHNKIRLTWGEYNSPIAEGFKVDRKIDTEEWRIGYAIIDKANTEWTDTMAVLNSQNSYRIYAFTGNSKSSLVEKSVKLTLVSPNNLEIQQISDVVVQLTWKDDSNVEDGFIVDKKIGQGDWEFNYGKVRSDTEVWIDTNGVLNLMNNYRIYAYSGIKYTSYNTDSLFLSFPSPTNFVIQGISDTEVQLMWNAHQFLNILGYIIERRINSGDFNEIETTNNTYYIDMGLSISNEYEYLITAYTKNNRSEPSVINRIAWVKQYEFDWQYILGRSSSICGFSPDGSTVATGTYDNKLVVLDSNNGDVLWSGSISGNLTSMDYSPDNLRIVSGSLGDEIKVWNTQTGNQLWSRNHIGVKAVHFSSDNMKILSGGADSTVNVWDAITGTLIWSKNSGSYITSVDFSLDLSKVAAAGEGKVSVWDANTGNLIWSDEEYGIKYDPVIFSPDNSMVVTGGSAIKAWDSVTGNLLWIGNHSSIIYSVNFSPDNSMVVSGSHDKTIKVWDSSTGNLFWEGINSGYVSYVSFSRDNSKVLSGSSDNMIKIWKISSGDLIWSVNNYQSVLAVSFNWDDSKIVSSNSVVKVWKYSGYSWQVINGE